MLQGIVDGGDRVIGRGLRVGSRDSYYDLVLTSEGVIENIVAFASEGSGNHVTGEFTSSSAYAHFLANGAGDTLSGAQFFGEPTTRAITISSNNGVTVTGCTFPNGQLKFIDGVTGNIVINTSIPDGVDGSTDGNTVILL